MLSSKKILELKNHIDGSVNPFIFFDDDPDGLASYLLLYRHIREGKGYPVKARSLITERFADYVNRAESDKVFVLDIGAVEEEFVSKVNAPIIVVDHHNIPQVRGVQYYDPVTESGEYIPTSRICYEVVKKDRWIAMIGCLYDHYWPDFAKTISRAFPDLLPSSVTDVSEARFTTAFGTLVKVFSFSVKGTTRDTKKSLSALRKISSPYEVLQQTTPEGRFVWKRFQEVNREYTILKSQALKQQVVRGVWVFVYEEAKYSVTKELIDEMLFLTPHAILILGRLRSGEYRCSFRSTEDIPLKNILLRALQGCEGYIGGHPHACGGVVSEKDFERFVEKIREDLVTWREKRHK